MAWAYLPLLLQRIRSFSQYHEGIGNPDALARAMEINFISDEPVLLALIIVDDDGQVIAHALVSLDEWLGTKYITLQQYQTDRAIPRDRINEGLRYIENWGRLRGAEEARAVVDGEKLQRAYKIFLGLKPYKMIMNKSLKEV